MILCSEETRKYVSIITTFKNQSNECFFILKCPSGVQRVCMVHKSTKKMNLDLSNKQYMYVVLYSSA